MAPRPINRLPPPPVDMGSRSLPLKRIQGVVYRIHRVNRTGLCFGKNISKRFDDPLGLFGVLYAALQPEAAFAEVFLRRLSLMFLRELDLQERALSQIACHTLQCVDLSGSGLRRISCDNRITTEMPYQTAGRWSRAFFEHPQQPDGIIYRSRHNPRFLCLALFERCQTKVTLDISEPLMAGSRRAWTIKQITRYNLAIEPMV
jgi:hypothetical protein